MYSFFLFWVFSINFFDTDRGYPTKLELAEGAQHPPLSHYILKVVPKHDSLLLLNILLR